MYTPVYLCIRKAPPKWKKSRVTFELSKYNREIRKKETKSCLPSLVEYNQRETWLLGLCKFANFCNDVHHNGLISVPPFTLYCAVRVEAYDEDCCRVIQVIYGYGEGPKLLPRYREWHEHIRPRRQLTCRASAEMVGRGWDYREWAVVRVSIRTVWRVWESMNWDADWNFGGKGVFCRTNYQEFSAKYVLRDKLQNKGRRFPCHLGGPVRIISPNATWSRFSVRTRKTWRQQSERRRRLGAGEVQEMGRRR